MPAQPANIIILGSCTHVGMKRSINQDAHCSLTGPSAPPGTDAFIAVADGMGGHQAGEVASRLAIQTLLTGLSQPEPIAPVDSNSASTDNLLAGTIVAANKEILQQANRPETRGMGTTITAGILRGNRLYLAHVGDSRGYLLRDGSLRQLTRDHSWVADEVARGSLTPQQAQVHPQRNILSRALGTASNVEVDSGSMRVKEGDVLLLCSDGLHGLVDDQAIAQVLAQCDPQEACELLVNLSNAAGGPDNVTAVVARIEKLSRKSGASNNALQQQTTMHFARLQKKNGWLGKIIRVVFFPVWFPIRALINLIRLPFRRN